MQQRREEIVPVLSGTIKNTSRYLRCITFGRASEYPLRHLRITTLSTYSNQEDLRLMRITIRRQVLLKKCIVFVANLFIGTTPEIHKEPYKASTYLRRRIVRDVDEPSIVHDGMFIHRQGVP